MTNSVRVQTKQNCSVRALFPLASLSHVLCVCLASLYVIFSLFCACYVYLPIPGIYMITFRDTHVHVMTLCNDVQHCRLTCSLKFDKLLMGSS